MEAGLANLSAVPQRGLAQHVALLDQRPVTNADAPRLPLTGWDERLGWLKRKLKDAGASAIEGRLDLVSQPRDTGRANGHRITIWPVLFEGLLIVQEADLLRQAMIRGIGPARAYGNGLLSVAPAG